VGFAFYAGRYREQRFVQGAALPLAQTS